MTKYDVFLPEAVVGHYQIEADNADHARRKLINGDDDVYLRGQETRSADYDNLVIES